MYIYVAGPYTKGGVAENVRRAIYDGDYIERIGHTAFVPHLTHFWHMFSHHEYEFWMQHDLKWLEKCDAIYRIPGECAGADREVNHALSLGLIVYGSVFDIPRADGKP